MYNIIIFIEVFIVIILYSFASTIFSFHPKFKLYGIPVFISDSFLLQNLHYYLINLTK